MVLTTLLIQLAVILAATQFVGWLLSRLHQPRVVGEMVAGIVLGPSLLGWLLPNVSAMVFPVESLGNLNALSQIGLILFMFLIGVEFDARLLGGRGHAAVITSHASIIVPFVLGAILAVATYPVLSPPTVPMLSFVLFTGLAMSITAFPVLARILTERGLLRTPVGTMAIACAAVDDVTAWCILAVIVVLVRTSEQATSLVVTLVGSAVYLGVMLIVVRRGLRRLETYYQRQGKITQGMLAIILLLMLASAWTTEMLGIHALFGAFLMGALMPKAEKFQHELFGKLEAVTVTLLLPLFFAFTGLRTSIGFLFGGQMWIYALVIIAVAIIGKIGGSTLTSKQFGMSWREAGALGIMMNTRGLIELVFLNIGLDLGVISPTFFSMMVLMALVTTFMTSPLLAWIYPTRLATRAVNVGAGTPDAAEIR
jgi:Kef-type K+ transport system membrane component KefB